MKRGARRHRSARDHARSRARGAGAGKLASQRRLCQHEDLLIDRFELLLPARLHRAGRDACATTSATSRPRPRCDSSPHQTADPWDFEEVYASLHDFARAYRFDTDAEDYLVHITTGSHVAQICLFLLTESRHIPGRLLQTSPPPRTQARRSRHVPHHRSRSLQVRPHRHPLRPRRAGRAVAPQVRHPDAQRRRSTRSSSGSIASRCGRRRRFCCSVRRAPASRCWRGASTS